MNLDYNKILVCRDRFNYRFSYNSSKLKIQINNIYLPFGKESYNKKDIINCEITNNDNTNNNIIHDAIFLEKIFDNFSKEDDNRDKTLPFIKIPFDFLKEVKYKSLLSTIKKSLNGYILRTHMTKNTEIYKKSLNNKIFLKSSELKDKYANIEVELSNIWVFQNSYGFVWNINKIEVL
jgi:hypothetical protein